MSTYLTVKNKESQEELIYIPVTQSAKIHSKGSWLYNQLSKVATQGTQEEGDFWEVFEVKTESLKPLLQTNLDQDQHWVINHFLDNADHLSVTVVN